MRSTQPEGHLSPPQQRNRHLPFEFQSSASPPLLMNHFSYLCQPLFLLFLMMMMMMIGMMMIPLMLFPKRRRLDSNYLIWEYTAISSYHHTSIHSKSWILWIPECMHTSREPSHLSSPNFDPPSQILHNAFSYIHKENGPSSDCVSRTKWCGGTDHTNSSTT